MSALTCTGDTGKNHSGNGGKQNPLEAGDDKANSSSAQKQSTIDSPDTRRIDAKEGGVGDKATDQDELTQQSERTMDWLSTKKQASESQCRKLEAKLVDAQAMITQQAARFVLFLDANPEDSFRFSN